MELKIPISDKLIWFVLAISCVGLGINYVYLMQRQWQGMYTLPLWLILIDIALVAGPMKDNKLLSYVILLSTAFFIEYQHLSVVKGKEFEPIYFSLLIILIYGSALLFFMLLLFGRLDRISVDHAAAGADLKALNEEASRLSKTIEKTIRGEGNEGSTVSPSSNYALYRRAISELFSMRTRKDVPGYLVRTLREGFGMERGVVMELPPEGESIVRELWGEGLSRTGAGMAAFKVPPGLMDMVRDKSGAVLESELMGGSGQEFVDAMVPTGFEPIGLFPLMVRDPGGAAGDERPAWVVMAVRPVKPSTFAEHNEAADEEEEPVKSPLRILPIQSVLDIAGQFVSRANMK